MKPACHVTQQKLKTENDPTASCYARVTRLTTKVCLRRVSISTRYVCLVSHMRHSIFCGRPITHRSPRRPDPTGNRRRSTRTGFHLRSGYQSVVSAAIQQLIGLAENGAGAHVCGCTGTTANAILTHFTNTHAHAPAARSPVCYLC